MTSPIWRSGRGQYCAEACVLRFPYGDTPQLRVGVRITSNVGTFRVRSITDDGTMVWLRPEALAALEDMK